MHFQSFVFLAFAASSHAWLPGQHRSIHSKEGVDLFKRNQNSRRFLPSNYGNSHNAIRGVNLGSLFVLENWLANDVMASWGCNSQSEFDCVSSLNNQATANADFENHWNTWITSDDFTEMVSYGLNTVRIPVGYWMLESIVDSSEHFPQGGEKYLDQVVGYAKAAGLYVIIDLHGAPGAQVTDADTGQFNPNPGFYSDYNYDRSYKFFEWMTNKIHTNPSYSTVGMIEVVNEPERTWDTSKYPNAATNAQSMRQTYYPGAWTTIRNKEAALGIAKDQELHIQMMDNKWGSGDPKQYLPDPSLWYAAYDDHQYVKYAGVAENKDAYIQFSCSDDRSGNWPVIVGEWSISPASDVEWTDDWNPTLSQNQQFYRQWWSAQVMSYERTAQGWIFWTWKTSGSLNDPRWDYKRGVAAGIIPKNPDDAYTMGVCGTPSKALKNRSTDNGAGLVRWGDHESILRSTVALVMVVVVAITGMA